MAGISLREVRSPEAPKITITRFTGFSIKSSIKCYNFLKVQGNNNMDEIIQA
jgi:hypothetical protein